MEEGNGKGTERLGARPKAKAKAGTGEKEKKEEGEEVAKEDANDEAEPFEDAMEDPPPHYVPPPAQGPTGSEDCRA